MAKELFFGWEWRLDSYNSTLCLHSFHIDSLNQTSLQGLRLIHHDQKLLYLFTQTLILLLKVNQSESECTLVSVHAHTGSCLGGVGRWSRLISTEHLEHCNSLLITLLCRYNEQTCGILNQRAPPAEQPRLHHSTQTGPSVVLSV